MYDAIANEIKQSYYQQKYPNDGQRFIAWYLRNIYNLDENETKACITDGPNDKQIDAIYIDDAACVVYVIQGKYYSGSIDAEPVRETLASWILLGDLEKLQEDANEKLKQRLVDLGDALADNYDVCFELLTTAELTASARSDLAAFQDKIAESDEFTASMTLVDSSEIERRYEIALGKENPSISHSMTLEPGKYASFTLGKTAAILAAVPLRDCLKIPGIKDQTLFRKNVRNSLGLSNKVNKAMRSSIANDPGDFFFCHNGITAICSKMELVDGCLRLEGLSVVNGCQSLNTIYSSSEKVKSQDCAYVMFRFYEIPERDRADKISISTNSQSAVKARDLRSNDKRVLLLKKTYEQLYPQGYMITKRGEEAPASANSDYIVDLSTLGKVLMAWHSQRPNISYSETKIFDKYFDNLFKKDYAPENVHALMTMWASVYSRWDKKSGNPLGLNESLLAMRSYAPYHHLYAISAFMAILNKMPDGSVPDPSITFAKLIDNNLLDQVIQITGVCLNNALESAASEILPNNRVFSPQNWVKTKGCLAAIRAAIRNYISFLPSMPGGKETAEAMNAALAMEPADFSERYTAD